MWAVTRKLRWLPCYSPGQLGGTDFSSGEIPLGYALFRKLQKLPRSGQRTKEPVAGFHFAPCITLPQLLEVDSGYEDP